MSKPATPSREEVAMVELGQTTISRTTAIFAVVLLLLTITVVPVIQVVHEVGAGGAPQVLDVFTSAPSERHFHQFERTLEDASVLGQHVLPPMQAMLARVGCGNEQAYLAPDGWLFYRPGFDYVTGRGFLSQPYCANVASVAAVGSNHPSPIRCRRSCSSATNCATAASSWC